MRFSFRMPLAMKPILWPFGATAKESWVDLEDDGIHIHFGHLFDHKLALRNVEKGEPAQWSLLRGLGIRIGGKGRLGVLAATDHVVRLTLKDKEYMHVLFGLAYPVTELFVAVDDPAAFIAELNRRLAGGH